MPDDLYSLVKTWAIRHARRMDHDPDGVLYKMITNDWSNLKTSFRMANPGVEVTNAKLVDAATSVLLDMQSGQMELFNA